MAACFDLTRAILCLLTCCGSLFHSWDDTARRQLWPATYCPAGRANPSEPTALPAAVVHFRRRSHEAGHLGRYFDATIPAFGIVHGLLGRLYRQCGDPVKVRPTQLRLLNNNAPNDGTLVL
jgi:hypothetical protein